MTDRSFEPAAVDRSSYRFGFVIEHAIGHVTFANMLRATVETDAEIEAEWFLLPPAYDGGPHLANLKGLIEHLPPFDRNPTALHSLRAKRMVSRRRRHLDAVLIHTQTAALLSWPMSRRRPVLVPLD